MRVLVAYERSGKVRQAFRERGHDAWSNDIVPADDGSDKHLEMDAKDAIAANRWDLIIMHCPCTALAVSGNAWYGIGKPKHKERLEAIEYTLGMLEHAKRYAPRVALENPVGVLSQRLRPSQYIQPYQFGHPESKKTGLWLHGLPLLTPTDDVRAAYDALPKAQAQRLHYLSPSADRAKIRSETFSGIAQAMAQQWGRA